MEENQPTRRWYRFSLRTIFVLGLLCCIYLAWAMNWIRQRREWLDQPSVAGMENPDDAPFLWPLLPFGEKRYRSIWVTDSDLMKESHRLFPEAVILESSLGLHDAQP